jgi:hypothetical protein
MNSQAHAVISCFNTDPSNLAEYFPSVSIYDQSDKKRFANLINSKFAEVITTPNSGHSLSHYIMYILKNYDNLPEYIYFLKSNLIGRHIDRITFEQILAKNTNRNGYVGFFHDSSFRDKRRIAYYLSAGLFIERNNAWYLKDKVTKYFNSYTDFLKFLYVKPIIPEYVPFTPGACFGVSGDQIRNVPKNAWEALLEISTYSYFPPEAYLVERALFTLLNSPFRFRHHFDSKILLDQELARILKQQSRKMILAKQRNRFLNRNGIVFKIYFKILSKYRFEITSRY